MSCGSYVPFDLENKKDKKAFDELPDKAREDKLIGYYTILNSDHPKEITFSEVPQFFKDKQKENLEVETNILQTEEKNEYKKEGKYSDLFKLKVSDVLGKIPAKKRTGHPLHESDTDANFSLTKDGTLGHCWRHLVSLNAVQYLCVKNGYSKCEDAGTPHKGRGISKIRGDKKAYKIAYEEAVKLGLIGEYKKEIKKSSSSILTRRGQIEEFWEGQPFFYDRSKLFWIWNKELLRWEVSDEIDFLNSIQESLGVETIETKIKTEFITGFKQVGRKHKPKDAPKHWVQFKEKIYDLKTGENFEASHEYFMTNPIPFNIGKSNETPTIDKYFKEWVGENHTKELYEITAYSITPDKFMQRMFALVGGGSNGKGTFIKLLEHFLGKENCVSSSLKAISEDKFEIAVLYRKLLCVMGEVSANDLRDTNQVKRIAGEDTMSFQFKGKTPFSDYMTTTCLCATNSLPTTPDKSLGFYRKWHIIDFPNQFKAIKKNLIESIPQEEWENLAFRSLEELKKLYETREFSNEGDFEERVKRYEERSNPVMRFVEEFFEEIPGKNIPLRDFTKLVNDYLRVKHLRVLSAIQVGKILRNDGFGVSQRRIDDVSQVVILNLSQRENHSNHPNHSKSVPPLYKTSVQYSTSSNGSNGFTKEELDQAAPELREFIEKQQK